MKSLEKRRQRLGVWFREGKIAPVFLKQCEDWKMPCRASPKYKKSRVKRVTWIEAAESKAFQDKRN